MVCGAVDERGLSLDGVRESVALQPPSNVANASESTADRTQPHAPENARDGGAV